MSVDELLHKHVVGGIRARNCLLRAGIRTIEQLITHSDDDLIKLPHLGRKSLNVVKRQLKERGLFLKGELKLPNIDDEISAAAKEVLSATLRLNKLIATKTTSSSAKSDS